MLPSPRRAVSQPGPISSSFADLDDDEGWEDMPVVRSQDAEFVAIGDDSDDPRHNHNQYRAPVRLDGEDPSGPSNATGAHLELEADTLLTDSWRQKVMADESDYTRIRLDEDEESEQVHMRTRYLFDEDKAMTPLSQMQATKELLTEGQRIAYVGLCYLIARRMVRETGRGWEGAKVNLKTKLKGKGKVEVPVVESANLWLLKIMARLFQHMDLNRAEQQMIESLGEHGVESADLVPALMTTHTVKNPEFDPKAKEEEAREKNRLKEEGREDEEEQPPPPPYTPRGTASSTVDGQGDVVDLSVGDEAHEKAAETEILPGTSPSDPDSPSRPKPTRQKSINPFGDDSDEEEPTSVPPPSSNITKRPQSPALRPSSIRLPSFHEDDDDGDIGRASSPQRPSASASTSPLPTPSDDDPPASPSLQSVSGIKPPNSQKSRSQSLSRSTPPPSSPALPSLKDRGNDDPTAAAVEENPIDSPTPQEKIDEPETDAQDLTKPSGLPSLPGVSTSLTNADEMVTLDIRWTVLCDLFLVLIADSVYDARSRVFLERVAEALGFSWLDVVRFENRITDALEIQEGVEKTEHGELIEGRRKGALKRRYAMMGAAAVGGGLIIGLSAGLLAPVIGAGLGAAFATVGISGTTGFLAGAGGAAMITTGGVLTGMNIAGKGMARRTREVRTFELRPLHNNKRVSCYITLGGFMASEVDDIRLPFSTLDPIVGDVLSVLWEPEMMAEMGNALKILTSEILTQVGQQVLQATVMYGLMSALQWPIILTKLGYLIDNPWSNALDRARAAGLILADVIANRHTGVRPVSLIGFSLGARAIFYALVELARMKAYGLVQDVFLFGATVTGSKQTWLDIRSVVAGRLVNGYATNDWMLGYLFRATSGGLNTVAGLRPVEVAPGMENVDVTEIITGHMSYRSCMPQLLAKVGFPVTAEYFDEPDDPNVDMTVQERVIVNEQEEEAKKNRKKLLGIFPRRQGKAGSGSSTPNRSSRPSEDNKVEGSGDKANRTSGETATDDDDDLPPREESDDDDLPPREEGDIGVPEYDIGLSQSTIEEDEALAQAKKEAEAVKAIPKTAGFDFQAISKQLGKEIDVENLKDQSRKQDAAPPLPMHNQPTPPLDRAGSAPPEVKIEPPTWSSPINQEPGPSSLARSSSFMDSFADREGFEDDITASLASATGGLALSDVPSWERPLPLPKDSASPSSPWGEPSSTFADASALQSPPLPMNTSPTAPLSSMKLPSFGFNAWSSTSSSSASTTNTLPLRSAPPARPHPAEYMVNPFAQSTTSTGVTKKEEELATGDQNPW